ncbi:hypothetical protein [Jeotgalibacillus campisalis]|uniref:Uncharacterized protein n=1 Tax=Jeotgalibacillus campisalis TaxID=220754 RepID=A0A0C2QYM5_9BACL|nr:hypothetical protein [Jeotgalibacillus campisalis]KIL43135.1 hypothetical protein KR50_35380 [Jeotgalibacillus campisalis]
MVEVGQHFRSAPDGIEQNNLSYEGPDKLVPNLEVVDVQSHTRTAPDGIVENNLSYQGPTGLQSIIHHDDPLRHVHEYKMDPLILG